MTSFRWRGIFVGFGRGATSFEWQVWKVYGGVPYWRFLRVGCRPYIRWDHDYDA